MNTQRKHEILNELETMDKRVRLLDSHKTQGLISEEQYQESGLVLLNRIKELEEECGINRPIFHAHGLMYDDEAELFNEVKDGTDNQDSIV